MYKSLMKRPKEDTLKDQPLPAKKFKEGSILSLVIDKTLRFLSITRDRIKSFAAWVVFGERRFLSFTKLYQPKEKLPLAKVKGIDGSLMPPWKTVQKQQIKRANSICSIWNQASVQYPIVFPPNNHGWIMEDGIVLFTGLRGMQHHLL